MRQTIVAKRPTTSFRWVVIGLVFVVYTIASADRANIGFALPFIRREFPMSNTESGALLSLFLWGYALMQIPSGLAVKRFGVRALFPAAMILTSIFTGVMGAAGSALALKMSRFLLGLAEGPLPVGITTTINNWFPAREKGLASGIFLSAVKFGPVVVPPICAVIVAAYGWREIFYFFALPGIVLSLVWYLLIADSPSESRFCSADEQTLIAEAGPRAAAAVAPVRSLGWLDTLIRARNPAPLETLPAVFRSWNMWGCALGYGFQLGISNVLLAWIPTYLISVKHFSVAGTGLVAAAPWVGAVVGNILGGWLSDRIIDRRRKPGMLFSALGTAGMMIALIHAPSDPIPFALLLLATGAVLSIGFSAYMAYPMALTAKPAFPVASALVNMGGQIGGAIAPLVVGILLDTVGWNAVFIFMATGSLISFLLVSSIIEPVRGLIQKS